MNSALADLVTQLNRRGYEASLNGRYGTIDIVRVHGRPLLDPWPLQVTSSELARVLVSLKDREGLGSSVAIELLASMIVQDVGSYEASDGPFRLNEHGYVVRPDPEQAATPTCALHSATKGAGLLVGRCVTHLSGSSKVCQAPATA